MAISECGIHNLDETSREKIAHGNHSFPVAIYREFLEKEEIIWHWHMEFELIRVVSGEGLFSCNGNCMQLKAGQGMFINSGNLHNCCVSPGGHCEIHSIVFHPRYVSGGTDTILWDRYLHPLMENRNLSYYCFDRNSPRERTVLDLIGDAWKKTLEEAEGFEFQVRADLSEIAFFLYQNMIIAEPENTENDIRKINRVKAMMEFVQANYPEDIKLEEIAASAMISDSECQRCFKSVLHITPVKYLMNIRIQNACELLTGTSLPAGKIAELSGFSDNSYFGKVFKKEMKVTPAEYRRIHGNTGRKKNSTEGLKAE